MTTALDNLPHNVQVTYIVPATQQHTDHLAGGHTPALSGALSCTVQPDILEYAAVRVVRGQGHEVYPVDEVRVRDCHHYHHRRPNL
jgi:hypothetical protein